MSSGFEQTVHGSYSDILMLLMNLYREVSQSA